MILFLAFAWIANILSLAVADWIFSGVNIDGFWPLVIGGAVLGVANTIVKPILTILTLPIVILTLALFLLVINVWIVNFVLHGPFGYPREKDSGTTAWPSTT